MKNMKLPELLNRRTILGKFFTLNLLLTLLPMVILSFVVYHISVDKLGDRAEKQVTSALQMGNHYIQRLYIDLKDVMNVITINSDIQQLLNDTPIDDYSYINHIREINSTISTITQNKSYITSFVLYSSQHEFNKQLYKHQSTYLKKEQGEKIFKTLLAENKIVWWNNRSLNNFESDSSKMVIGRVLRNIKNNYEPSAFILLEIEKAAFFEGLAFLNSSSDSQFFVVDSDGDLVHYLETLKESKFLSQASSLSSLEELPLNIIEETVIDGEKYIVSSESIENMPWRFIYLIEASKFYSDASFIQTVTIGVLFIVFLLGCIIAYFFSKAITSPLNQLSMVIKSNKFSDEELKHFNPNDEVGKIGIQFIKMLRENKRLNNQVIQAILKRKEAEIHALQAQINPHFLYNTLDSINWLAISHKQFQISEIVSSLGSFFRLSLSRGKKIITIDDEIDHITAYVKVQKFRYKDLFDVVLEVEDDIRKFYIPKLILQPVVENALYHGIKAKNEPGIIMITGEMFEEGILFNITDDGQGMKKEHLNRLNRSLYGEDLIQLYGLKNVHERLRLQFGVPYGVSVYSEYGMFTTVTIKIPKLTTNIKEDYSYD